MNGYCFDTDIISATIKPAPPLQLIRRLATVPAAEQFTTAITAGTSGGYPASSSRTG